MNNKMYYLIDKKMYYLIDKKIVELTKCRLIACVYFNFLFVVFKEMLFHVIGVGIGLVFGSLIIGYARNPSLKQQVFNYAILGFALSEAMGLFCLMIAFLILYAF